MKTYIIQHLPSSSWDYSDCGSVDAAWEQESQESWVKDAQDLAKSEAEFRASITEYTAAEVLQAHLDGYGWPKELDLLGDMDLPELLKNHDWATIVHYMDSELAEDLHTELAPCSEVEFFTAYAKAHEQKYGEEFTIN